MTLTLSVVGSFRDSAVFHEKISTFFFGQYEAEVLDSFDCCFDDQAGIRDDPRVLSPHSISCEGVAGADFAFVLICIPTICAVSMALALFATHSF